MISKLQKKKNDPFSKYWENKCNKVFWEIFNIQYAVSYCRIGYDEGFKNCKGRIERHHLIKKDNYLTKWEFQNILELCSHHHSRYGKQLGPHSTPILFSVWLEEKFPYKWGWLRRNKNIIIRKVDLPFTLKQKYLELEKELKNLNDITIRQSE